MLFQNDFQPKVHHHIKKKNKVEQRNTDQAQKNTILKLSEPNKYLYGFRTSITAQINAFFVTALLGFNIAIFPRKYVTYVKFWEMKRNQFVFTPLK